MKVKASVTKRCPKCYVVIRTKKGAHKPHKKVVYVYCSANPRHKQKQG
ncbi:MAG: 50S ribosomal protein L36 [Patescibacteria group bacterium]|uniref:50S ribosomal protein L36 n=1 Tax=Candidatus Dojkabacteria bacterium CG_4_10_14_0_2_um_filter_Dojkabacteria_WS6_41_15 TaxID=2014249 RepID=A0A2M7W1P9_9BACT|nr:50S ribosomal protein L36 [bacterium]PIY18252.1 MAG: 50S ribosomal protein L36 [Candidatus Dojkabacteria bacterium CG_4_10_14_3_um_filter_Dojkabacteria_WS6_41_9]PJA12545.1 MAG: 50S ribosomal protein L36 [Candidatus Dojkabacteria bacterium CG_4_10_14_0_2_um_filter_Dojkabacteria_WS6_41_15]PJB22979.1 MAG: 50S ribosomal protein L36 [Candidatus Dojkabacteria bacterium CG_4_9_14_3_um_filter_150_Dojkabacteria_WS6_41_13]